MKKVALSGKLITADVAQQEKIEATLSATQNNNTLEITWNHLGDTEHEFTIANIDRKETASEDSFKLGLGKVGVDKKGNPKLKSLPWVTFKL